MAEQTLRLPDGTAVVLRTESGDLTATGGWLAECLCAAAPSHPDRIEVVFGAPAADGVPPVVVMLAWDRTPKHPVTAPPRIVADQPPGLVIPPQRPGSAPPGLPA